jgi:hypothetical protein
MSTIRLVPTNSWHSARNNRRGAYRHVVANPCGQPGNSLPLPKLGALVCVPVGSRLMAQIQAIQFKVLSFGEIDHCWLPITPGS